ncbi:hypothetical protein Hypma_006100 [Hypsizygus marmoreus]|uniref:Uncharacterized protein n=1 Tax=Hypsizygus marmoreus TaxID=39966 RepID=A0A369JW36_HYPMA|nr:hypothetical protein Hypma_006100 [Hypsizygus marmoreus]
MFDLVLCVQYELNRVESLTELDPKSVALAIRRDFDLLKLPHPAEANIRKPTRDGVVVVSWLTFKNSIVHDIVSRIVDEQNTNAAIRTVKDRCYIENLYLRNTSMKVERTRKLEYQRFSRRAHSPSRSRSPPPRRGSSSNSRTRVNKIERVIRSLRELNTSLQVEQDNDWLALKSAAPSGDVDRRELSSSRWPARRKVVLTDELSQARKRLTSAVLRIAEIEKQLLTLGSSAPPENYSSSSRGPLIQATVDLILEKQKRKATQLLLQDVKRECVHPSVVPMLLQRLNSSVQGNLPPPGSGEIAE